MKVCTKCKTDKSLSEFHATKRNEDGTVKYRSSWCRNCKSENYHNKSKAPKRVITFIDLDLKIKQCAACKSRLPFSEFTKSTKGSGGIASYCIPCMKTKYYDKQYSREQSSRYRSENKASWNANHRVTQFNRVSKIKAVSDGTVTKEFAESVYNTNICYWCKKFTPRKQRTMEHLIELSSGGLHSASNITMACKPCNSSRFNKGVKHESNYSNSSSAQ